MTRYKYTANDKRGKTVRGVVEAPDADTAIGQLRSMGYYPLHVQEQKSESAQIDLGEVLSSLPGVKWLRSVLSGEGRPNIKPLLELRKRRSSEGSTGHLMLEPARRRTNSIPDGEYLLLEFQQDRTALIIVRLTGGRVEIRSISSSFAPEGDSPLSEEDQVDSVRRTIEKNFLTSMPFILAVPDGMGLMKRLTFPRSSPDRMLHMLEFEVKQLPPDPRLVYLCDLSEDEAGSTVNVEMFALHEDLYERYLKFLKKLSMKSTGLCFTASPISLETSLLLRQLSPATEDFTFVLTEAT